MIYRHELEERRARATYDAGDRELPPFAGPEYWEDQDEYLRARGLSPRLARLNGWYPSVQAGDSALRIVMPASPMVMKFWQARLLEEPSRGLMQKRYQSPHGARGPAVIIVYPNRIVDLTVVIVEGPMDALAAADAGAIGVSLMGNTPGPPPLEYIAVSFPTFRALVVPDRDAVDAGARIMLMLVGHGMSAALLPLPPAWKDLADVPADKRAEFLGVGA